MKRHRQPHERPTSHPDPEKRQFQLQLLAIALAGIGGLVGYLDLQPLVSGALVLAGLATLFLTPRL